jgi:hypothetical protein
MAIARYRTLFVTFAPLAITGACIQVVDQPKRILSVEAIDPSGARIADFVFVRLLQGEKLHGVEEPARNHWLSPQITNVQLIHGEGLVSEAAYKELEGVTFGPFVGLSAQRHSMYRVYAIGYSVWRAVGGPGSVRWSSDQTKVVFELEPLNGVSAAGRPGQTGGEKRMDHFVSKKEESSILADLADDSFWSQIQELWKAEINRTPLRYLAKYYVERIESLRMTQRPFQLSTTAQNRFLWLKQIEGPLYLRTRG